MQPDAGDTFTTSEDSMTTDTTITPAEYEALRFPAHADILRRTTPITNATERGLPDDADDVYPKGTLTGLVCGVMTDRAIIAWDCCEQWDRVEFAGLALDLFDATGRAHLAWWIAHNIQRHPLRSEVPDAAEAPMVGSYTLRWDGAFIISGRVGNTPRLWRWVGRRETVTAVGDLPVVPALATLDPNDPRTLPDGSRLVDALALAAVGRHLLGGGK